MHSMRKALLTIFMILGIASCAETGSTCEIIESRELRDDENSPEGVRGADVLALAGEPLEMPFTWLPGPSNATPSEDVTVSLRVERTAESVRYVVTTSPSAEDHCGPAVHVPVRFYIETSDGGLAEVFERDLVYDLLRSSLGGVHEVAAIERGDFSFEDLQGWLRPTLEGGKIFGDLYAQFGAEERGSIAVRQEIRTEDYGQERFEVLGEWGNYDSE